MVERPEEAFASNDPQYLIPVGSGQSGRPTHFPGQAVMADVVRGPRGYVSVGTVYPGWHPVAWTSPDGATWTDHVVPTFGPADMREQMTTVVAGPGGFLAGGSVGPETLGQARPILALDRWLGVDAGAGRRNRP